MTTVHQRRGVESRPREAAGSEALSKLVGESPAFRAAVREAAQVARYDVPVLLEGETGTGKELFARFIHASSARRDEPLVIVNCAALPSELMENEFFGHSKGAFTHATANRDGYVKEAHGGTLFLDEIASLDLRLQAKLLRFAQNGEYRPLGARGHRVADVRLLAATNVPLDELIESGAFREDLFYRLGVFTFELPALRERAEDVPLLVEHFLDHYADKFGVRPPKLARVDLKALSDHEWPGNVRELQNVVQQVVIRHAGEPVASVVPFLRRRAMNASRFDRLGGTFQEAKTRVIQEFEVGYLDRLLRRHGGNVSEAARASGKHRRALTELLRKHGIDADAYRDRR